MSTFLEEVEESERKSLPGQNAKAQESVPASEIDPHKFEIVDSLFLYTALNKAAQFLA